MSGIWKIKGNQLGGVHHRNQLFQPLITSSWSFGGGRPTLFYNNTLNTNIQQLNYGRLRLLLKNLILFAGVKSWRLFEDDVRGGKVENGLEITVKTIQITIQLFNHSNPKTLSYCKKSIAISQKSTKLR